MSFRTITPEFSAFGQVSQADLQTAVDQGFKSLIINRPDNEEPGQPTAAETTAAAEALGLQVRFIPMVGGQMTQDHIDQTILALDELPSPVLAHCRSGMRSTTLWAMANKGNMSADEIIGTAGEAGYDLNGLRAALS